uniref:GDP-Man:Man(3)GlcNAc(2)-PP-Dol alpha-1,2-mannosyltransferase n=1 Tax=Hirondellea gigas TaxID=1518452 RepID=A0A2P2ICP3_9CRUS
MITMLEETLELCKESIELMFAEMDLMIRILVLLIPLILLELLLLVIGVFLFFGLLRLLGMLAEHNNDSSRVSVGFFHPYSGAGGGGERVLWCAIRTLQNKYQTVDVIIYTGDSSLSQDELQLHVHDRFNITLPRSVRLIHLHTRLLLEAKNYPRLTLLLQALASNIVACEAVAKYRPDVFIDTMGYSFMYPVVKAMTGSSVKIACYIHYPIISTDMLSVVEGREEAHNNAGFIADSGVLSACKSCYYRQFSRAYGWVGRKADLIMVNSTWTNGHISSIWNVADRTKLVFPSCDISKFTSLDILPYEEKLIKKIVSIGQFRPEKDHALQLRSFKRLLELVSERGGDIDSVEVQLVLVGGVRGPQDEDRVKQLQNLAVELGIQTQVEWRVNMPFSQLTELLQESCVGLHTMWNEHFGISVVEMQAAGLITVAHDSGGPKMDIVTPHKGNLTGLLASDLESYAESMYTALTMCDEDRETMQQAAVESSLRFTDENFEREFGQCFNEVMIGSAQ